MISIIIHVVGSVALFGSGWFIGGKHVASVAAAAAKAAAVVADVKKVV